MLRRRKCAALEPQKLLAGPIAGVGTKATLAQRGVGAPAPWSMLRRRKCAALEKVRRTFPQVASEMTPGLALQESGPFWLKCAALEKVRRSIDSSPPQDPRVVGGL